jgi:N-acetyl-anhydromuramyl-L-alanine amidase AmpD
MSQVDYALAEWRGSPNFWPGGDGNKYVVIHATASGGKEYVPDFSNPASQKSTNYAVAKDGHVVQYVREVDSAWGNCCATGDSPFDHHYNYNKDSISIENEKWSSDNSEPLEPAQYQSLLALVRDICKRQHIPIVHGTPAQPGIIFHHDLDPVNRARCPGTFPYDTFLQDLQGENQPVSELITNNGAVADLRQSFQLDGGSQDKCGPWSVAELKYAGLPGKGPMGTAKEVGKWGSDEYVKHIGLDIPSDTAGSSIENMHQFFHDAGNLHYWDMDAIAPSSAQSSDLAHVRRALAAGYPVVVTVNEQSVISKKLGKCPYPWQPRLGPVNHIFSIVGVDKDGDFICADELNNQESWLMVYKAANIEMHWASVVQLVGPDPGHPWLKPIPSGDPTSWPQGFNAQNFGNKANTGQEQMSVLQDKDSLEAAVAQAQAALNAAQAVLAQAKTTAQQPPAEAVDPALVAAIKTAVSVLQPFVH